MVLVTDVALPLVCLDSDVHMRAVERRKKERKLLNILYSY